MDESQQVLELLEAMLESGQSPEEVCHACPELLAEVRQRWQQFCRIDAEVQALLPVQGTTPAAYAILPGSRPAELPAVPGYEVQAVLGCGGMGVVFRARHLSLNRLVALKMALAGAYMIPQHRERFHREAEAVAALKHPNIVQIYDVGAADGTPYFTMEYIEGGNLAQKLAGTPQPARQAAMLVGTLAGAVQAAHQGGIVHRDLKPSNVLLTADGTPKIADFGLARHYDGGPALTMSGVRVGTPSYMAPEQAIGKTSAIGPASDIYALGAILYELLTGRPPFRGETATETERQVIAEEPVPPSRLNRTVPRDLETICLKCLQKNPQRRYATAADLAEDLERFQRNEPIATRRAGRLERTAKWVRRHPTPVSILAATLLVALMLVAGALSLAVEQAHRRDEVETDLKELQRLRESARWDEAQAALQRAAAQLDGGGPDDLRRRLDQARRDLELVIELDKVRLQRVTRGELPFYKAQGSQHYAAAFERAGLGTIHDPPSLVASRIDASEVCEALVAAVYDWAVCAPEKAQRGWLLEVAQQTTPSSDGWRRRALDPAVWEDLPALTELARTAPVASEPVSLLLAIGERLAAVHGDATALLQRVQKEHPEDFWANLIVGNAMHQWAPQEAAGYYRAVLASRPWTAVGYCAVGDASRLQNKLDEAAHYYKKALEHDANYSRGHSNLGLVLRDLGRADEAIASYRKALQLDPDYGWAHHNLGDVLREKGRLNEAYDHFHEVIRVDPTNPQVHYCLATVLVPQGRGREAEVGWQQALALAPTDHIAWSGYPELCLFLGQQEEYHTVRRALLDRFGATTSPWIAEPVGRSCLLLPGTEDELRKAAALIDHAIAAKGTTPEWIYRYYLFAKALAEYRQDRPASAISLLEGESSRVMGPAPRLVLAMAQHAQRPQQARRTLATAMAGFDWGPAQADNRDVWIAHVLRREAEGRILPDLPALLAGERQPRDNAERLALVAAYQLQGRFCAAAQAQADGFAAEPGLAEDLASACRSRAALGDTQPVGRVEELAAAGRYPAARCAALAGCGLGEDGAKLGASERAHWRKQARDWLRADLSMWAQTLDSGPPAARVLVKGVLTHWRTDRDLAGLREPGELEKLSVDERKECLALWNEVEVALQRAETHP
jgi:serine/threonine-protein kinase